MRSIRLSLLVYFLGLLTLAFGAAAVLAYRTGQQTLIAKKETTAKLVEAQYKDRCREADQRLNDALLAEAQTLAGVAQFHFDWNQMRSRSVHMLGLYSAMQAPNGYVLAPVWIAEGVRSPIAHELFWRKQSRNDLASIRFNESDLLKHIDGQVAEFFQIDSSWGGTYHSKSLGKHSFPLDKETFAPDQTLHWEYLESQLRPGVLVRRVILKAPATKDLPFGNRPRPPRSPSTGPPPERSADPSTELQPRQPIYIQCACKLDNHQAELTQFKDRRDEELANLDDETRASLTGLRNRLLLIGTLTFAATVVGSFGLVWLGLVPLRRLSEAVSRVSPKRLQLPIDAQKMPVELRPIVCRLTETLEQLRRAFEREKQATADISHELRTPLAALLTTTEIALRKPRTPDEYRELFEDCRLSAQQMNHAVERLLTLARLDAGMDHLRSQSVDAAALAEQCAAIVRPLAEARNLALYVHRNGAAPLTTDPDKLREVMTNLLHNAIQYNRPKGRVELSVGTAGGRLHVAVRDTGIGIAPEERTRIFERFYRADPSRGADGLHSGLGLAIVKEYVDLMGGSIVVESVLGEGSTFRISLPLSGQVR